MERALVHPPHHCRKYVRWFLICCIFLFFMLMRYVPANNQSRGHGDQAPAVSIPGWSYNTSRDLRLYVLPENMTAVIPQPDICSKKLYLLVIVCSSVNNFEVRNAIRQTWAVAPIVTNASNAIRVAFLLGEPENTTMQELVDEESTRFGDIIQEGFLDTYNNLTLKTVMMLKWTLMHCPSVHYVMKTDDDMFVNIDSLVRLLRLKGGPGLLLGTLICGAHPISDPQSKWYAPRYMFSGRVYPNYLSGTGYVMSGDVIPRLYKAALETPLFHLEDVYLTGLCAKVAGIRPRDHPAFTYGRRRLDPCLLRDRSVVTSHHVDSAQLHWLWGHIQNPALDCSTFSTSQKPVLKASKRVASLRRPGSRCV